MKVLVVDDDVVSRMLLMHLVDSCGDYAIVEAEDGADAWHQLEQGLQPDLIFCDLRMPHLSGTELLARVRAQPALAAIPFVLVSAANDAASLDAAAALGADGYVQKPFQIAALRTHLMALEESEAPTACAQRLGIDRARLALYLGGLERQLQAADSSLAALLAQGDSEAATAALAHLREGCAMLGLHAGASRLARAAAAPRPAAVSAALAAARAAVTRQQAALDSGQHAFFTAEPNRDQS